MSPVRATQSTLASLRRIGFVLLWLGPALGCSPALPAAGSSTDPLIRGAQPEDGPRVPGKAAGSVPAIKIPPAASRPVPISLDTVFRLAADSNGQIALGREKLNESLANQDLAAMRWLPDVAAGTSYLRHEGGIQDFYGNLITSSYGSLFAGMEMRGKLDLRDATYRKVEAARQVWQQKGDLSKLTAENLLDASTTYIDLLAAYTGVAIGNDMEVKLGSLLAQAQKLADVDPGAKVEVSRVLAELHAQKQVTRKLREACVSASAKLAYLLGLDPDGELVPIERKMPELNRRFLVDPHQPAQVLIDQALRQGPGVRELAGLLQVIDEARVQATGMSKYMPSLEVVAAEGLFGAGPDANMSFTNRFDLAVNLRWNLTEFLTARQRLRVADSKIMQAHLGFQELKAKLTLGVREARESSLSNVEIMQMGEKQIRSAEDSYNFSDSRLRNKIQGSSPSEVLQSLRGLVGARLGYLNAVREMDKAQLRLFVLVGANREQRVNDS